jgi:hypothetical protein
MSDKKLEPRLERMLMFQTVGQLVIGIFSSIASIYLCGNTLGWTIMSMVAAGILSWFTMKLGIILSTVFFQLVFYKGDYTAMLTDAHKAQEILNRRQDVIINRVGGPMPPAELLKIIKTDEKPIGTFNDAPFYEWIEVMGKDGRSYRFNYHGTDASRTPKKRPVPADCILVPPGILYQVAPEINTTA